VLTNVQEIEYLTLLEIEEKEKIVPKLNLIRSPLRYKVLWGGRGGGKSWAVAKVLLQMGRENKLRILCTREVQKTIKDSVHKLLSDQIKECGYSDYTITRETILNTRTGSEFIFVGLNQLGDKDKIKSMEGIDLCWCEEAQSLSDESLERLIPTIRKDYSEIWFTFNKFSHMDPVVKRFCNKNDPDILEIKINYNENPWCPQEILKDAEKLKETDFDRYLHVYLGEPVSQLDQAIISRVDLMKAVARDISDEGAIQIGADIARFGDDRTVFYKRKGLKTIDSMVIKKSDLVYVAQELMSFAENTSNKIKVDDTGLGGGVTDILKYNGYNVDPINNGSAPTDRDNFANLISEMWFYFKDLVPEISIPEDDELIFELTNRAYKYDIKGRKAVEPKEQFKKRNKFSPDKGDAFLLCYYDVDTTSLFILPNVI